MCSVPPDRKIMKSTMKTITQKKKIAWERTRKKSRRKKEEKETDDKEIQVEKDEEEFQKDDDVFTTPGQENDFSPASTPTNMPYTMRGTQFHAHHLGQDYSNRDGLCTVISRHSSSAAKHQKQDSCVSNELSTFNNRETSSVMHSQEKSKNTMSEILPLNIPIDRIPQLHTPLHSCTSPWSGFFRYTSPWTAFFSHISQCT